MTFPTSFWFLVRQALIQVPTAIIAGVAWNFLQQHKSTQPESSKWALLGFALAGAQILLVPLSQFVSIGLIHWLPTDDVALRSNLIQYSVLTQTILWSLFHAFVYFCLFQSLKKLLAQPSA